MYIIRFLMVSPFRAFGSKLWLAANSSHLFILICENVRYKMDMGGELRATICALGIFTESILFRKLDAGHGLFCGGNRFRKQGILELG